MRYKKIGMPNFFIQHSSLGIFLILQITTAQRFQKQILENVSKALSPNGTLVYCTCSIAKEEGEMQITSFLATHKEFQISPLSSVEFPSIITPEGFIRTLPSHLHQQGGCDSFFIARLTKVK